MSKVSIIIPVYNGHKVIGRCLDSILSQDYKDLEIIAVDDGSKDDSYEILKEYEAKDERVKAIHKENGGVSSTRNRGIEEATGEYIRFVDVDDWLPFDSTKLLVRAMEEDGTDMAIGDFYRVVDENVARKGSIKESGKIDRSVYAEHMLHTPADFYYGVLWNKLYRRDIIEREKIRMDNSISFCEDMIFNLEYLLHVKEVSVVKSPVYYYVHTEGSLVDQGMNIPSIVKMKTDVITYYNDFYKNILRAEEYEARKPAIYSYLVAVSTDSFAIPFVEDTKKLGEESGRIFYDDDLSSSEILFNYFSQNMITRLLYSLAQQLRLDIQDMKILYLLYRKGSACHIEEIMNYTGIKNPALTISLTKLVTMDYIKFADFDFFHEHSFLLMYNAGSLDDKLKKIEEDYLAICFDGLSEEEKLLSMELKEKVFANLKKTLLQG